MKKNLLAILATVLMSMGLVGAVQAPAQAACPYSACIPTETKSKHPGTITGKTITVKVSVKPLSGTGTPVGTVRVSVKKYNSTFKVVQTKAYNGGKVAFDFSGLKKKGKYRVLAKFFPSEGSVYLKSKKRSTFIKV
jgi:hypothetical protein